MQKCLVYVNLLDQGNKLTGPDVGPMQEKFEGFQPRN